MLSAAWNGYSIDSGYRMVNKKLESKGKNTTFRIAHMGDVSLEELKDFTKKLENHF